MNIYSSKRIDKIRV